MTAHWSVKPWTAVIGNPARAYELVSAPVRPQALRAVLAFLATAVPKESSFVVVRLARGDDLAVREAIDAANESTLSSRLCFAVCRSTLQIVHFKELDNDRAGLMLDNVDAETPLTDIANDFIEAVRFDSEFVGRAHRNLRQGCVLDAMMGLARNLGLCTLGPQQTDTDAATASNAKFDYVPESPFACEASHKPLARAGSR